MTKDATRFSPVHQRLEALRPEWALVDGMPTVVGDFGVLDAISIEHCDTDPICG